MASSIGIASLLEGLNPGQQAAIASPARLVVVPACPGSGKTKMFVGAIASEMLNPRSERGGIAALSFTNVAEREVRKRLYGRSAGLGHPHFIGTIDTFLLRYVVRSFGGHLINMKRFSHPVDDKDFSIQSETLGEGNRRRRLAEYSLILDGERTTVYLDRQPVADADTARVVNRMKLAAWQRGHVMYDDVCYVAAQLLADEGVRGIVIDRFPVILVDEFQDTGGSRESALMRLFRDERLLRCMVVGDPDQCIMQFNLARPNLFDDVLALPGAAEIKLATTHRFHSGIAVVTQHLSRRTEALETVPFPPKCESASTVLLVHDFAYATTDLNGVPRALEKLVDAHGIYAASDPPAILAWAGRSVARLRGTARLAEPDFDCRWLEWLFAALRLLHEGDAAGAFKKVERIMASGCSFPGASPTEADIAEKGISRQEWKRLVWGVALSIRPATRDETVLAWIARVKSILKVPFESLGVEPRVISNKVKAQTGSLGLRIVVTAIRTLIEGEPYLDNKALFVDTVHQAKGREFPAVCYFLPKPRQGDEGIVDSWFGEWSNEHARISYVALTRAKQCLMIVMPRVWHDELSQSKEGVAFLASFGQVCSLDDYLRPIPQ